MAASMGATAFQKGLGMIHSLAHPLSSECGLHHGLANALMLPASVKFLQGNDLNRDQRERLERVRLLFKDKSLARATLSDSCFTFFESLGIQMGLRHHGVQESQLDVLADKAIKDGCHQTNMIPVTRDQLRKVLQESY